MSLSVRLGLQKLSVYGVAGCPLFRGCFSIEVNERTVGTFRIVRYIMGVRFQGCPLPLYQPIFFFFYESLCKAADTNSNKLMVKCTQE